MVTFRLSFNFFFFSSRRRHTRLQGDWSSDVCSSDLFGEVKPDEKVPSSVVAPNLALAHQRLQRRWVRHWVQEPPIIQVGTAMPPFLSGLAALKLDGLSWPRSQMLPEPEVQRIEATYGSTPDEQASLPLDFLYAPGARHYT